MCVCVNEWKRVIVEGWSKFIVGKDIFCRHSSLLYKSVCVVWTFFWNQNKTKLKLNEIKWRQKEDSLVFSIAFTAILDWKIVCVCECVTVCAWYELLWLIVFFSFHISFCDCITKRVLDKRMRASQREWTRVKQNTFMYGGWWDR